MLSIAVCPERYSYEIIQAVGEFAVNEPSLRQGKAADWCDMVAVRDADKFCAAGLTPAPALEVGRPIVLECPLSIECRVRQALDPRSPALPAAEVVADQVIASLLNAKGRLRLERAGLFAFTHGQSCALGRMIGRFSCSVKKRKQQDPPLKKRCS